MVIEYHVPFVSFSRFGWQPTLMRLDEKDSACSRRKIGSRCHFSGKTLAGWWLSHPSEKYEFVSWDDEIPNIWKKKCSKPPTRREKRSKTLKKLPEYHGENPMNNGQKIRGMISRLQYMGHRQSKIGIWCAQKVVWFTHSIIELDDGKIYRKALYLMVKTMVSCRFSLKPIQWLNISLRIPYEFIEGWPLPHGNDQPM